MQYVRLDRLPQLSSKRSELSDFLLSLSSLRDITTHGLVDMLADIDTSGNETLGEWVDKITGVC
jgi:hypothetical protein